MNRTCGVFVFNPDKTLLICHVTNSDEQTWSIPKGRPNVGEQSIDAAVRELWEETGLSVDAADLAPAGTAFYKSGRELVAYTYHSKNTIDPAALKCASVVTKNDVSFPEVDAFRFVDPAEVIKSGLVHHTQQSLISRISNI